MSLHNGRFGNRDAESAGVSRRQIVNEDARPYLLILFACAAIATLVSFAPQSSSAQKQYKKWTIGGFAKYVTIPGASSAGDETCATCHSQVIADFRHAFHAQQGIGCEDCHGAGSLHVEGGGDVTKIVSYRLRSARDANGACLSCHAQDEGVRNWMAGSHMANNVRCTDCHQVHGQKKGGKESVRLNFDTASLGRVKAVEDLVPESKVMMEPRWQKNDSCLRCHQEQRGQMSLPYHHPLREGKMTCVDCHDPHGGAGGNNLRVANVNQLCLGCHAQYRGPFTYQHPPVTENCLACHTPHGSPNTNLLQVSEPALCLQCHAGHHNGANLPLADRCTNCHISVHGTDIPSPTGGSVFVDKGPFNAPGALSATASTKMRAPHPAIGPSAAPPIIGALGGMSTPMASLMAGLLPAAPGGSSQQEPGPAPQDNYLDFSFSPMAYRFIDRSGFTGRVGEYDSLQQSVGGDAEAAYVSVPHHTTLLARANVLTGDDYHVQSELTVGETLRASFDLRSFFQQQDNYPFYASVISPDIVPTNNIPDGSVFGIKRRLGDASARVKLPKLPVHLFVKGSWQARVGQSQLAWYDMGGDSGCNFCHFTSQFQPVNYTTRNVGGGAEVKLGRVSLMWEHDFSSFNDRLQFPMGTFGATLGFPLTPDVLPPGVPDTPVGTYVIAPPAPNQYSSDAVRLNWTASAQLVVNGDIGYTRLRNMFTQNPQNIFSSNATVNWHPLNRLRFTADYHQQNVLNNFTPLYPLYGDMSYHEHVAGLKAEYSLKPRLDVEARYERSNITRSNSQLWPQFYSPDNTDLLYVVPSSSSNTAGLALRYHGGEHWSARTGYEWTGTHDPGYLTVPQSNNRTFADATLSPASWLDLTSDTSLTIQNAFAVIQRRDRFYSETFVANARPLSYWNLGLGYSYQQFNLNTYMALQNDPTVGYVLDAPFVPYKQLSQTYWVQSASRFWQERMGFNLRFTYNSARSGMQPDLNPNDAALMGNQSLIQQGLFDPVLFGQALSTGLNGDPNQGAFKLAATQISQVIVPEYVGQAKVYYVCRADSIQEWSSTTAAIAINGTRT
jgi:predicted CXXCH cytochrome family protein